MNPSVLFIGLAGLAIGSFGSVVAYRVPRGESIGGRSHCTSCGSQIAAYDNIPILSWVLLRGRCRSCQAAIPVRYPLIELATAVLFVAVGLHFSGDAAQIALGCLLVATLAIVTLTDLERRIIPNPVLAVSAIAWAIVAGASDPDLVIEGLIAAAAAGGLLFVIAMAYPQGMGMGDVKLVAVMGLYLGSSITVALLGGLLVGSIAGAVLIARHGSEARKQAIPFGPFLALGGVVGLFAGPEIVDWYTTTFFGG